MSTLRERHVRALAEQGGLHAFLDRLKALYAQMDGAYGRVAAAHGFVCRGCEDNCCATRFHHHTLAECVGLWSGCLELEESAWKEVERRARSAAGPAGAGGPLADRGEQMCPLNFDGRCIVYPVRPMICRLHGVAHEIRFPGRPVQTGPGCDVFEMHATARGKAYMPLDRTPLYLGMAALENDLRTHLGFTGRIHKTVAEVLTADLLSPSGF